MRIEIVDQYSPHLPAIKALGRADAQTLGFFPEGAFEDYAARRGILVALDDSDQCLGYVLYRTTRGYALIVHLCVASAVRGQGVARTLVDRLCAETTHLKGIRADCRRDFPADRMWPRLGFHASGERPGRAKDGSTLTIWWVDHGHANLFTGLNLEQLELKLLVAIDANIFFDLVEPSRPHRDEAQALRAEWLQAEIELAVSDELWNEIRRNPDEGQRRRSRVEADGMTRFPTTREAVDLAYRRLKPLFPVHRSSNDESDLRHIAQAVAGDVHFFVTRDSDILDRADQVYAATGLTILRPSDLVVHLDSLRREKAYQPARLAGTLLETRLIQPREQASLAGYFQAEPAEERRAFDLLLRRYLSAPQASQCFIALDDNQQPVSLTVYDESTEDVLRICLFRVRKGPLRTTLIRYGLHAAILRAIEGVRRVIRLEDPHLDNEIVGALRGDGFARDATGWVKLAPAIAATRAGLVAELRSIATTHSELLPHIQPLSLVLEEHSELPLATAVDVERLLWPAKIVDAAIPTFLVPIQPVWAQELFDTKLSEQTLFGALKRLPLNREGVYYRASHPRVLSAPGRILWYVSRGKGEAIQDTMAIRACSRIEEVVVGKPKELFRQFRRLGIYEWKHVLDAAKGNENQSLMAVRFSGTELFNMPIGLEELRARYTAFGKRPVLQGPSRVAPRELFEQLYRHGIRRKDQTPR